MSDEDPALLNLDVYDTKAGLWNPDHGNIELPVGWEFLASGDAFITRRVKSAGVYWTAWQPRGKNRPHRRKLGLFAPTVAIEAARADAEATEARRAKQRAANERHRDRVEDAYRAEFLDAVRVWLAFAPKHAALAEEIAGLAADQAVVVGSGRVGRTRTVTLGERAELAARATIRHRYTSYEDRLAELDPFDTEFDDFEYRRIRRDAHVAVDRFLDDHRGESRA